MGDPRFQLELVFAAMATVLSVMPLAMLFRLTPELPRSQRVAAGNGHSTRSGAVQNSTPRHIRTQGLIQRSTRADPLRDVIHAGRNTTRPGGAQIEIGGRSVSNNCLPDFDINGRRRGALQVPWVTVQFRVTGVAVPTVKAIVGVVEPAVMLAPVPEIDHE